jgi:hypothetical protein
MISDLWGIPETTQKVVNIFPEWVAGLFRNQWQVISGIGGSFGPESTAGRDR